jgi:hypothetical protein
MKEIKLSDLNISDIGNTIQLVGSMYSGNGQIYFCQFPEEHLENLEVVLLKMDAIDWQRFLRQTDLMETEILAKGPEGITKAVVRKTLRQIDSSLMWRVYKRDNYTCRYCGIAGIPLTVDHCILWEELGPTTMENLVSACKQCNRTRGRMQYSDWLNSDYYRRVSQNLTAEIKQANIDLVEAIKHIDKVQNRRSR